MTTSPILIVAGNALAHLTRPLSLAPLLRDAGYSVIVAAEGTQWRSLVEDAGYPVITLPLTGGSDPVPDPDHRSTACGPRAAAH